MSCPNLITVDLRLPIAACTLRAFAVESLGDDLYRIAEIPSVFAEGEIEYGDTVQLVACADWAYELRSVTEPGNWRRYEFAVSADYQRSGAGLDFLSRVEASSGKWVIDFGGYLIVVLPPDARWDPYEA